jgi:hypothetical protein
MTADEQHKQKDANQHVGDQHIMSPSNILPGKVTYVTT